jgi:signal transduction histidine kinase
MEALIKTLGHRRALAVAVGVVMVFGALAFWVWQEQRRHRIVLLERHTNDVAIQASRRLQVFVESHLRVAAILAERWSTHENADFSKTRFEQLASVVLKQLPGYAAIGLVDAAARSQWSVPETDEVEKLVHTPGWSRAIAALARGESVFLSQPVQSEEKEAGFYALLPLRRVSTSLGYLVVLFRVKTLITDCFHSRIQSEFYFQVRDDDHLLFQSSPSVKPAAFEIQPIRAGISFGIRNQEWRLTMIPKERFRVSWSDDAAVALLGLFLSIGMGVLTFLLVRRVAMYKVARDKALMEIEQRQKAEESRDLAIQRLALLSRKAMAAQEEERARLSIEMHDELGQILTALRLNMALVEKQLHDVYHIPGNTLSKAVEMAENATEELRRLCKGLRPPLLDDLGLVPAIRLLVKEFQEHAGVQVTLDLPGDEKRITPTAVVSLTAYRILQESLTNVRRHANAENVYVTLVQSDEALTLIIQDDGLGFDMSGLGAQQGCGLEGMRERANLAVGHLEVRSQPNKGTRVVFHAPLQSR